MIGMLMPSLYGIDNIQDSINRNILNATLSQTIIQAAIENMKRCVGVNLFNHPRETGLPTSSATLARYFPWMQLPQELPKLRQRRLAYYKLQLSQLKQIEQLNGLDAVIFCAALEQMHEQQLRYTE